MSEIKLNLLDSHTLLTATAHGSVGDSLVAALSAEPDTIDELESALKRFKKCDSIPASSLRRGPRGPIDQQPWDAGILVVDLAARIVASESTYSEPTRKGTVAYHDGTHSTNFPLRYLLPADWLFLRSVENYEARLNHRLKEREPCATLDTRSILYGKPLLEFIVESVQLLDTTAKRKRRQHRESVIDIHRRWLMTPRDDLNGQSVRDILFAKRELIDFDLESRMHQWSFFLEEPPPLSKESHAYRFAGYGTHEWVMYYHLVRFLIWETLELKLDSQSHVNHLMSSGCCRSKSVISPLDKLSTRDASTMSSNSMKKAEGRSRVNFRKKSDPTNVELVAYLAEQQAQWLSNPNEDLDGYIPADVIENERRRRPEAMTGRSMVVDESCYCCKMMGDESEAGLGIYFCFFDGCNMESEFAFSSYATLEEWKEEQHRFDEWTSKSERERKEASTTFMDLDDCEIPF